MQLVENIYSKSFHRNRTLVEVSADSKLSWEQNAFRFPIAVLIFFKVICW